jgi:hypothetical protein
VEIADDFGMTVRAVVAALEFEGAEAAREAWRN